MTQQPASETRLFRVSMGNQTHVDRVVRRMELQLGVTQSQVDG